MEKQKNGLTILKNKVAAVFGSAIAAIAGVLVPDNPSNIANQFDYTANPSFSQVTFTKLKTVPVLKLNLNNSNDNHLIAMHGSHKSHSSHSSHKSHSSHRSGGFS